MKTRMATVLAVVLAVLALTPPVQANLAQSVAVVLGDERTPGGGEAALQRLLTARQQAIQEAQARARGAQEAYLKLAHATRQAVRYLAGYQANWLAAAFRDTDASQFLADVWLLNRAASRGLQDLHRLQAAQLQAQAEQAKAVSESQVLSVLSAAVHARRQAEQGLAPSQRLPSGLPVALEQMWQFWAPTALTLYWPNLVARLANPVQWLTPVTEHTYLLSDRLLDERLHTSAFGLVSLPAAHMVQRSDGVLLHLESDQINLLVVGDWQLKGSLLTFQPRTAYLDGYALPAQDWRGLWEQHPLSLDLTPLGKDITLTRQNGVLLLTVH